MNSKYLIFFGMGFELVGLMLASIYVGNLLDQSYNMSGLAIAGLSLVCLFGWIIHIVYLARQLERGDQKTKDE